MRLRNSRVLILLTSLLLSGIGTRSQETDTKSSKPGGTSQPAASDQGNPTAQPQDSAPVSTESGVFVIKRQVDEVLLHATVVDNKQRMIMDLERGAFSVYENDKPQPITSFRREDVPVAMGIVIDNSGSMREKRDKVNKAAVNLVRASNPRDQVFVVNFN